MRYIFHVRIIISTVCLLASAPAFATNIQEVKSKSGITAWLVEEHAQPLISVHITFRDSGSAYDPDGKDGRTAMTSSMLMEGAGNMDSEAFSKALETSAIKLSFTSDTDNFYAVLNTLSEEKEKAFNYLSLALTQPRFDDSSLARIKRQTLLAIKQQQEKPYYRLSRAWQERIFANHPYSKDDMGTEKTVSNLSKIELQNFVKKYLTKENIIVSVAGDITPDELTILLDKNLSNLPANYKPDVKIADISPPKDNKQIVIEQDIPQTIIHFGVEGIKRSDPDYITAYVMNYLLGGGTLTSRLNTEIREKRGLTYSASSTLTQMKHTALFEGGFSTRNEKAGEAISALKQTLNELSQNGINESELSDIKRFLVGSFVVKLDDNNSVASFLSMMQLHHLGIDYINKRNDLINSVSVKQVNEMAKRLIHIDNLQIIMVGKPILNTAGKE